MEFLKHKLEKVGHIQTISRKLKIKSESLLYIDKRHSVQ